VECERAPPPKSVTVEDVHVVYVRVFNNENLSDSDVRLDPQQRQFFTFGLFDVCSKARDSQCHLLLQAQAAECA